MELSAFAIFATNDGLRVDAPNGGPLGMMDASGTATDGPLVPMDALVAATDGPLVPVDALVDVRVDGSSPR